MNLEFIRYWRWLPPRLSWRGKKNSDSWTTSGGITFLGMDRTNLGSRKSHSNFHYRYSIILLYQRFGGERSRRGLQNRDLSSGVALISWEDTNAPPDDNTKEQAKFFWIEIFGTESPAAEQLVEICSHCSATTVEGIVHEALEAASTSTDESPSFHNAAAASSNKIDKGARWQSAAVKFTRVSSERHALVLMTTLESTYLTSS